MSLKAMLRAHGLSEREFGRFLAQLGASYYRVVEIWDGVRPTVVEVGAGGEVHRYRAHDIRMLAARC
jgi:hypothetical protein